VSGHDFSRANKVSKMRRALAPAIPSLSEFAFHSDFFRSLLSRADKVGKMSRALAPADPSLAEFAFRLDFFRSLFSRTAKAAENLGL
jgi:hypothetical protein